ncbi:hypothetical protein Ancab_009935 [Ancistrocladus abbreviatus]
MPLEARVFGWKSLKNIPPTKHLLTTKGVTIDPRCTHPEASNETNHHVLFQCDNLSESWKQHFQGSLLIPIGQDNLEPVWNFFKRTSTEQIETFLMVLWPL